MKNQAPKDAAAIHFWWEKNSLKNFRTQISWSEFCAKDFTFQRTHLIIHDDDDNEDFDNKNKEDDQLVVSAHFKTIRQIGSFPQGSGWK